MQNKRLMVISGIVLIISIILLVIAYFMPSEKIIADCINITPLTEAQIKPDNLEKANKNFEMCKTSLAENDKKFEDTSWKSLSTEELYGENGRVPYVNSMEKFLVVKDSLTILDDLIDNGTILAKFKAQINHDELGVNQVFEEMKRLVGEYKSYDQETKALEKINKEQAAVMKKYFNK